MAVFIIFSGYLYFCVSFTNLLKKEKSIDNHQIINAFFTSRGDWSFIVTCNKLIILSLDKTVLGYSSVSVYFCLLLYSSVYSIAFSIFSN